MAWWREAKFGMFIHWGLYSILEGEWKGSKGHAEWIRETARIPVAEYEKLLDRFNPVKFDADAWVKMAKDAGMRYIVITSKHHDGFCLFDSAHTEWDVMSTPFKRDILKELSEACKRQGIRFCTYHSIMDWHHPDYLPKRGWEGETWRQAKIGVGDLSNYVPDFNKFNDYLQNQVREIIAKYDPGVMWFDGEWEATWTHAYGKPLYELCLKANPSIIVNNRVDKGRGGMAGMTTGDHLGDFGTPEQEIPATGFPGVDWESCLTMNRNWGWNREDKDFKSTQSMIRMLADVASKGGNLLMNIGPKPDGTFPEESVQRLREMGEWMRVHGESIYGTQPSPFKNLPWGRCTVKRSGEDSTLYFHVFEWPKNGRLVIPGIGNRHRWARILSPVPSPNLSVRRVGADIEVTVPRAAPNPVLPVVALRIQGDPVVYQAPEIRAASEIFVRPLLVTIDPGSEELEVRFTLDGKEPSPASPRYAGPFRIEQTTTVKARAFHRGSPVSGVSSATFRRVEPVAAKRIEGDFESGLQWESYAGEWDRLPDFSKLQREAEGVMDMVTLGDFAKRERVALVLKGYLLLRSDDAYVFALTSDDGSRLWIGDKLVVDNDGLHGPVTLRGVLALGAGLHPIRVEWFNKTGGTALQLEMAPVGSTLAEVPPPFFKRKAP